MQSLSIQVGLAEVSCYLRNSLLPILLPFMQQEKVLLVFRILFKIRDLTFQVRHRDKLYGFFLNLSPRPPSITSRAKY